MLYFIYVTDREDRRSSNRAKMKTRKFQEIFLSLVIRAVRRDTQALFASHIHPSRSLIIIFPSYSSIFRYGSSCGQNTKWLLLALELSAEGKETGREGGVRDREIYRLLDGLYGEIFSLVFRPHEWDIIRSDVGVIATGWESVRLSLSLFLPKGERERERERGTEMIEPKLTHLLNHPPFSQVVCMLRILWIYEVIRVGDIPNNLYVPRLEITYFYTYEQNLYLSLHVLYIFRHKYISSRLPLLYS